MEKTVVRKIKVVNLRTEGTLLLILLVLGIALSIATDNFLTPGNLSNLVRQTSVSGIVALGMTFVIIAGGIDLSVGSSVGFAGIFVALLMTKGGLPIIPSVIISLIVTTAFGVLNGVMIFDGKVPPFIATLGTMTIVRGAIMLVSGAKMVAGLPKPFLDFSQNTFLMLPNLFVVWFLLILICAFVAAETRFGRNVYTIGSSTEVARLCGINIRMNTYMIYGVCAFLSAVAGILMTSRLANGIPTGGQGYELEAIAASVVGGASLSGAEGTILGTVLGAVIMAVIRNGGNLLGIDPFILQMVNGFLIIFAVLIDQMRKMRMK
ncbi:MAG TPA: ABC transporter permease [Spirochaetia bacterium]|jgi:ribose transport system permease protein|nr:ABC transporter permease [Spirochaetia bacterium]